MMALAQKTEGRSHEPHGAWRRDPHRSTVGDSCLDLAVDELRVTAVLEHPCLPRHALAREI